MGERGGRAALHKAFREAPSKFSGNVPLSGNPLPYDITGLITQFYDRQQLAAAKPTVL